MPDPGLDPARPVFETRCRRAGRACRSSPRRAQRRQPPADGADLWVPRISSTSCDQAVFVDQASDASVFSDAVLLKIDRFG